MTATTNLFLPYENILSKKLCWKKITCRSYKSFNETKFCHDLELALLKEEMHSHDINSYSKLTEVFSNTLERHAPLKFKLSEVIKSPSWLRN